MTINATVSNWKLEQERRQAGKTGTRDIERDQQTVSSQERDPDDTYDDNWTDTRTEREWR